MSMIDKCTMHCNAKCQCLIQFMCVDNDIAILTCIVSSVFAFIHEGSRQLFDSNQFSCFSRKCTGHCHVLIRSLLHDIFLFTVRQCTPHQAPCHCPSSVVVECTLHCTEHLLPADWLLLGTGSCLLPSLKPSPDCKAAKQTVRDCDSDRTGWTTLAPLGTTALAGKIKSEACKEKQLVEPGEICH